MSIFSLFQSQLHLPRVTQQTDSHCGPAVVEALLAYLHRQVSQEDIVTAAKVRSRIKAHGTRPDQLARAVEKLAPDLQFWFKQPTRISDLEILIKKHHWPIAVNWQGLFYDTEEEQERKNPGADHGHYSVVVDINPLKDKITIFDPYAEYAAKPRVFSLKWFEKRWWDVDHHIDRKTGHKNSIKTKRLIFVIVPPSATFPKQLKMKLPDKLSILQFNPAVAVKTKAVKKKVVKKKKKV